jgi:type IV secretion system protein VirB4
MSDQEKKTSKVKLKLPHPDFIPYTCHFDENTILLKNNHLMQTLKITGFAQELVGKSQSDLKTTIRSSLAKNITEDNIAIYLHTIRKKKNLRPKGEFKNEFCRALDNSWNRLHKWEHKFVNELYLTIIIEAKPTNKVGKGGLLSKFSFMLFKSGVRKHIEENHKVLCQVTDGIMNDLENLGARKLGIYQREGIYYSQPLRFLSKIINLNQDFFPLKDNDLSQDLIMSKLAFGSDSYQIRNSSENYLGSLFSIKEYSDLSPSLIDKFLKLPMEFIISQSLSFVDPKLVLEQYQTYQKHVKIGHDKRFARDIGIDALLEFDNNQKTAFGRQQLLVNILAKTPDDLSRNVEQALKILISYGLTCVRENIYLENCFWSQLPGNFCHLIRKNSTTTASFGGFGSLSNFPAGSIENNKWGEPISIFYTSSQTPYFFNFHHEENGHSLVLGPYGSGKTVLLNFLIAQTAKIDFNLYYFDFFNSAEIFVNALDGSYKTLMLRDFDLKINPFDVDDSEISKDYLFSFLSMLTIEKDEVSNNQITQSNDKKLLLQKVVARLLSLPKEQRNMKSVAAMLKNTPLGEKISFWANDGKFAKFFDHNTCDFQIESGKDNIYGFDLTNIAESKIILYPLVAYFLNKIEQASVDKKPAIVVLDEAWRMIDNPFMALKLDAIMESFQKKNIVIIFASESIDDVANSNMTNKLTSKLSTQIYLPNKNINESYKKLFNLSEAEYALMENIKENNRKFLLKHANEAIAAELDLSSLEDIIAILSSNEYGIEIMQQVKAKTNGHSSEWIPIYLDILSDIFNKEDIDFADLEEELLEIDINEYRNRAAREVMDESQEKIQQGEISRTADDDIDDEVLINEEISSIQSSEDQAPDQIKQDNQKDHNADLAIDENHLSVEEVEDSEAKAS